MIDSGANPNCISLRCVQGSSQLKVLSRSAYTGKQMVDANGEPIQPSFVIKCKLTLGTPSISIVTEFVVIKSLPFSCIIGQQALRRFNSWEVSNVNRLLTLNKTCVVPFQDSCDNNNVSGVQLITTQKTVIQPFSSTMVDVRAVGAELDTFRPQSDINVIVEGNEKLCNRLSIEVLPAINVLTHQNCSQMLKVYNLSQLPKIIAKGSKLASCSTEYELCESEAVHVNLISQSDPIELLCSKITDLNPREMKEAREFLCGYKDILTVSNKDIGRTSIQMFDVNDENLNPVTVPLRGVPLHHKDIVQKLINKYEQLHLLEPIESPFRASTVLIEKKNIAECDDVTDKYRLCTDYRALNKRLVSSGWPSPSLDECLNSIGDADLFSSIDFNMGYFQIPCTNRAKEALAFSPGYGFKQYTWSVMPPGAKTASGCFQQAMSKAFHGHEHCILPPFYDDVTIKSRGFREHLQNAKTILDDVRAANFTLNALKCSFFQKKIKYLGHVISEHSIEVDPSRIECVMNLPAPQDVKSLRRFIGMIQFCHKFVKDLNSVLSPLYQLLKKNIPFVWTDDCQKAFNQLKSILASPPVLYSPTVGDDFILETDASDIGLGGCLKATNSRGNFVVGYCSKKFVDNEIRWSIVEKEGFAILYAVRHFHHFLAGKKFTINCDNRVVCYINDKNQPRNKKLLNWALELSDYDFNINHIPSKNNEIADGLSRLMVVSSESTNILSNEDFEQGQHTDNECKEAMVYVSSGRKNFDVEKLGSLKRHRKHLHIENNVLMWKNKYVVPQGLRDRILRWCHDHPMSGHFATERTYQRFSEQYFWPGAPTDVENFVNNCEKCNQFNPPRNKYVKVPLQPIETTQRFELVCYDLAGPFTPVTARGNCYVLIIVDHFTHWPEFVPLRDITAPTIATTLFDQWCCRYGTPERFHSDGAKNVHGEVVKELCKHIGVDKSKSSRLHPQGDGMAESFVKQLKSCIQKQVENNGSNWDLFIQATAFAIRSNLAYNTKLSPAELVFGSKLTKPIDRLVNVQPKSFSQKQAVAFAKDLRARIKSSQSIVNELLVDSREQMKRQFDKSTVPVPFEVGDRVMLWKPYKKKGLSGCFQPKWDGPWMIEKFCGSNNTNCKIVKCEEPTSKLNVHVSQLKRIKHQSGLSETRERELDQRDIHIPISTSKDEFVDYLVDFDEDDVVNNDNEPPHPELNDNNEPLRPPVVAERPRVQHLQIGRPWVAVDESNIIHGARTRGRRPDYEAMAAGEEEL